VACEYGVQSFKHDHLQKNPPKRVSSPRPARL
jgi:hypothetical protein